MRKLITIFSFILLLGFINNNYCSAQTATLGNIITTPGNDVLVPIDFSGLYNIGSIMLFISFDDNVLTYNGITNIDPGASGTFAVLISDPPRVGISWIGSSGVDFPDDKYLDIQFTFSGGSSDLIFEESNCEIATFDFIILDVTYINGNVSEQGITFNLNVLLEGAYEQGSGGTMKTDLLDSGNIPTIQPFGPSLPYYGNSDPDWYYSGSESVTSIPTGTVDWILVELRDAASVLEATEATIVAQKPCFLLNDGSIVDLNGSSSPIFNTSFTHGAFVVIWHRNHLGIMSSIQVPGFGGSYFYNFTTGSSQVAGGDAGYIELESDVWGMVAGDLNADKTINAQDKNLAWVTDAASQGYSGSDANLDIQVNNPDKNDYILQNISKFSGIPD